MRRVKFLGGKDVPLLPYDVDTTWSRTHLASLTQALILVGGYWTDAYTGLTPPTDGRDAVLLRVWIPEGCESRFKAISGCEIAPPPTVYVGTRRATCKCCGRVFHPDSDDDPEDTVRTPGAFVDVCSEFCAGRLVGRNDAIASIASLDQGAKP